MNVSNHRKCRQGRHVKPGSGAAAPAAGGPAVASTSASSSPDAVKVRPMLTAVTPSTLGVRRHAVDGDTQEDRGTFKPELVTFLLDNNADHTDRRIQDFNMAACLAQTVHAAHQRNT